MTIQILRSFLLYCSVINYAILILWWVLFTVCHDWMNRILTRLCSLPVEKMDQAQFTAIVIYKMGIIMFNIVPLVALIIATR